MPYIGNSPAANFASVTKDTFSGDGSTTAFTLSKAATTNGVAVYVENVRQIPTTAYTVSGTTLDFGSGNAPVSGTNNIYVLHHNAPASTANHPASQDLTATAGTFTSTLTANAGITMGGTTPTLTIGDAGAEDAKIVFDGNAQDYHIGLDDSADSLIIGKGSALGTTSHIVTDENGHVTMPLQPAFNISNITVTQSNIAVDSETTVVFGTERFDNNGDVSSNTFTAPVTGKYQLNTMIRFGNIDSAADYYYLKIKTSNREYLHIFDPDFGQDNVWWTSPLSVLADMDANDTCTVVVNQSGGTQQTDLDSGTGSCHLSGYLVA